MFNNVNTSGVESGGDFIGGQVIHPTDVYPTKVKMAYVTKSNSSQAQAVVLHLDINGSEHRETIWVTSGKGEAFYEKDGKKKFLPGWETVSDLCMLLTERPLDKIATEDRIVRLYNFEKRAEENTSVPVLVDILNGEVLVALQEVKEDKTKKNDSTGKYEPTGEYRQVNRVVKFIHPSTKGTVHEHVKGIEPGTYHDKWLTQFKGKVHDATDKTAGAPKSGMPGQPPAAGGGQPAAETSSLFDRNK